MVACPPPTARRSPPSLPPAATLSAAGPRGAYGVVRRGLSSISLVAGGVARLCAFTDRRRLRPLRSAPSRSVCVPLLALRVFRTSSQIIVCYKCQFFTGPNGSGFSWIIVSCFCRPCPIHRLSYLPHPSDVHAEADPRWMHAPLGRSPAIGCSSLNTATMCLFVLFGKRLL